MAKKKRKRTEATSLDSIEHARALVRRGWVDLGIEEPEDSVGHARELVGKGFADLAHRRDAS